MNIYVPGKGQGSAKLVIIKESPSYDDEKALEPFSGSEGRELDRILKSAGINRQDVWLTFVSKFALPAPQKGKKETFISRCEKIGVNYQTQIDDLRRELQSINPNCILALGETALWALTGKHKIDDYRGSILSTWLGKKLVATYNPAGFLGYSSEGVKDYWKRQICIFDFKRAKEQAEFPEIVRPYRNLSVARNSSDIYQFIGDHAKQDKLSIDIEATDCVPNCVGLAFRSEAGLTIPLWQSVNDSDLASSWIQLAKILHSANKKKVGQNFKYDQDKITRLGLPIDKLFSDVMLKAFVINPELPKNLAFNTSIYTTEPFYKNEGMYEGSENDLFIGCARDACVTLEIDDKMELDLAELELQPFFYNFIMHLHQLYLEIENEGFDVDVLKRDELIKKYIEWDEKLRYEMFSMSGDYVNTASPKQVAILLYDTLKIPFRQGTGEEVLTQLLNNTLKPNDDRRKVVENILESRRVRRTLSNNLTAIRDYDGKIRTTYFICLDTGRSSTGQQEPPIRPREEIIEIDDKGKKKKKKKDLGTPFQVMTKHGDIGADVRQMYKAPDGYVFLQADSAQAEARVIFLLAEDYEALHLIDSHDYHALTTSWFFGGTEDTYSKKVLGYECPERFIGKTLRHAGHLGASKRRAAISVNTDARKFKIKNKEGGILSITEGDADKALKIFHKRQPKIKEVFQASIIKCLEKNRQLISPVPHGINAPIGGKRTFYERWGEDLFRAAFSYIPQRTVSENTKAAALRIRAEAPWIRIILESHDSLLVIVPLEREHEAASILKSEFEKGINFSACSVPRGNLIIPCEVERGFNYHEMSKYKWLVTS